MYTYTHSYIDMICFFMYTHIYIYFCIDFYVFTCIYAHMYLYLNHFYDDFTASIFEHSMNPSPFLPLTHIYVYTYVYTIYTCMYIHVHLFINHFNDHCMTRTSFNFYEFLSPSPLSSSHSRTELHSGAMPTKRRVFAPADVRKFRR